MAKAIARGDVISFKGVSGMSDKYIVTRVQPFVDGDLTVRFDIEPYPSITAWSSSVPEEKE